MKKIISLALVWGLVLFLLAPLGYAEGEEGGEIPDEPEITGYIEVIKTVSNAFEGMPDRDFGFIIRLSDPDDYIPYEELNYQIVGIDGVNEYRHVENGGIFYLKSGQRARFSSILNGRPYQIHEIPSANFIQTMTNEYTGQHDGTETQLEFVDLYTPDDNSIKVVKIVSDKEETTPEKLFQFRITLSGDGVSEDELLYQITDSQGNVYHDADFIYDGGSYEDYRRVENGGIFSLADGQTARFPFIQSGHSYVIHEIPSVNFVQVQPENDYSGTFSGTETPLLFNNRYRSDNALEISKSVSNVSESPNDEFRFVINLSGENISENELKYEVADREGNICERNGERYFSPDSEGIFTVKDGQTARFPFIESGHTYQIYEVPMPHFHQIKPVQSDYHGEYDGTKKRLEFVNKYISDSEITKAVFENTRKNEGLEVMKTVTNKDEFTPDVAFKFTITLSAGSGEVSNDELNYQIINIEGKVYDSEGGLHGQYLEDGETIDIEYHLYRTMENGGTFYLKDGQIARFPFIKPERTYEIGEGEEDRFVQIQPSVGTNYTGKYEGEGKRLEFINEYTPRSDPNYLTVKKRISAPIGYAYDSDMEFCFQIKVNDELYANQNFVVINKDNVSREERTDENGIFYLKADEEALFQRNAPFEYYIEEIISDSQRELGWRTVSDSFVYNTTSENNDVIFVNTNASLVVQKVMIDGSDTEDSFVFHITDIYERGLRAKYYLYDTSGNILDNGQIHTTSSSEEDVSEDGEFTLKANQAAYFIGLTQGRTYNIYEEFTDGYVQRVPTTSTGYNVEIKNRAEVLTFKNDRQTLKGVLKVNKRVTDIVPSETAPPDKEFTFRLLKFNDSTNEWEAVSGESYTINEGTSQITYTTDDEGRFVLVKNETAVFKHLPKPNRYKVIEESLEDSEYKDGTGGEGIEGELTYNDYLNFIYNNLYKPEMTDIVITKIDSGDTSKRLAGAKFTIYTDEAMTKILEESTASVENGKVTFHNLKAGIYYIKETKAPPYYDLNQSAVKVRVFSDSEREGRLNVMISSPTSESELSVEQKTEEDDNFSNPYFVLNTDFDENDFAENSCLYLRVTDNKATLLPRAGGALLWFNIAGWILFLAGFAGTATAIVRRLRK